MEMPNTYNATSDLQINTGFFQSHTHIKQTNCLLLFALTTGSIGDPFPGDPLPPTPGPPSPTPGPREGSRGRGSQGPREGRAGGKFER